MGSASTETGIILVMLLAAMPCLLVGCLTTSQIPDRATVSGHLGERFGYTLPCQSGFCQITMPPGASLDDRLTDDEAVAIALWNNAAFQELLVDLGIARSDLIQAKLLPNPEFVYFFSMPHKPFKYLFDFPIEAHRTVDQHRPQGGLPGHAAAYPGGHGRLPRHVLRRANVPPGAE